MIEHEHDQEYVKRQIVTSLMRNGNRAVAECILSKAMFLLRDEGTKPQILVMEAINNSAQLMEVIGRKRGRTKIFFPRQASPSKRLSIALKWIVSGARARLDYSMSTRLANEFTSLAKGQGNGVRQKMALHQLAFKNRNNTY